MRFLNFFKRHWVLAVGVTVVYCGGYLLARSQHTLIHRVSYATDNGGKIYYHHISTGDFGPGVLQGIGTRLVFTASYEVFTPLRWAEACVWYLIPRAYAA